MDLFIKVFFLIYDHCILQIKIVFLDDQLQQAVNNTNKNELRAIYHLTETLVPGLRERVVYRSFRQSDKENWQTLDKKFMEFNCNDTKINDKISCMLKNIGELPKGKILLVM